MRDPSSYTVVGLGTNARDETVFLEKRISYVTAIIQSAFSHLSQGRCKWFLRKRVVGQTLPDSGPLPQKGAQCLALIKETLRRILYFFVFLFGTPRTT